MTPTRVLIIYLIKCNIIGQKNPKYTENSFNEYDSDCSDYSVTLDEIPPESVIFSHRNLPQMCNTNNRSRKSKKTEIFKDMNFDGFANFLPDFNDHYEKRKFEKKVEIEVEIDQHFR